MSDKHLPIEFDCWHESHFEIVRAIALELDKDQPCGTIELICSVQGHGGMYELAKDMTNEFETLHADTVWGEDLDFQDEIESFINSKLK
jgi:hypothetical protein